LNIEMEKLLDDVRRLTLPLPFGIDHVHCYFLRSGDGSWTLVDTGLGSPDPEAVWGPALAELDGPLERVLVTHLHPDHVGGAADVAALTGAVVLQGGLDHEQTVLVWGDAETPGRVAAHFERHGMAADEAEQLRVESLRLQPRVHFAREVQVLDPGDRVDGWEVLHLPGHADGHLALLRDGVLVAGDAILAEITPTVGRYAGGAPDPLRAYLGSLDRLAALDLRVAFTGHRDPVRDPAARAREITEHHADRLDVALHSLASGPRTAAEVAVAIFGPELSVPLRRFAVAEALAHLERLVEAGRAASVDGGDVQRFAAAS
jgi:glyoxylase-like metal-dependent hydrolase (beta-lactamase superfamily II)